MPGTRLARLAVSVTITGSAFLLLQVQPIVVRLCSRGLGEFQLSRQCVCCSLTVWQARHGLVYDTPHKSQRGWSGPPGGVSRGSVTVSCTGESSDTAVLLPRYHARVRCRTGVGQCKHSSAPASFSFFYWYVSPPRGRLRLSLLRLTPRRAQLSPAY